MNFKLGTIKKVIYGLCFFLVTSFIKPIEIKNPSNVEKSENLIIITIDGVRWQEVFKGANEDILNNKKYTKSNISNSLFWDNDTTLRRKRLMPFLWNYLAPNGLLLGNRTEGSNMNVDNPYSFSYPGYSEMFCGEVNLVVNSNKKEYNKNINVFEYLNTLDSFKNNIAMFSSWDVLPYILAQNRTGLPINSGYENRDSNLLCSKINNLQQKAYIEKLETRNDRLTFTAAHEYLKNKHPKILYIGLGEPDEDAHNSNYDMYLQHIQSIDMMISELWCTIQINPFYKNKTNLIITTDHGRGKGKNNWTSHGIFINGSSQTWFAGLGPSFENQKIIAQNKNNFYQKQIAQTIAETLGENYFLVNKNAANSIFKN